MSIARGVSYRPDIDGMRALAVGVVVLCHFGVPGFAGGYIGVDVFFVISGFLIAAIVRREIEHGEFSIVAFYERRARRILPALFVVLACVMIAGHLLASSIDYRNIGRAAIATIAFASNIYFFISTTDYFSTQFSPLLHTWSLGVEEQFYLFFPLLIVLIVKVYKRALVPVVLALSLASLAFAIYVTPLFPKATFFLLLGRAWELGIGATLALVRVPELRSRIARESLAAVGLLAVLVPVLVIDETTPYPGWWTVLPCLGAAALIYSGGSGSALVTRILSLPPIVGLGLISYSLYLWHWPLVSFFRYYTAEWELGGLAVAALIVASIVLSWTTYLFIETPFRRRSTIGRKALVAFSGATAAVLFAFAGSIWITGGYPFRGSAVPPWLTATLAEAAEFQSNPCLARGGEVPSATDCVFGNRDYSVVLWGDSEAAHLAPLLQGIVARDSRFGWRQVTRAGCAALPGLTILPSGVMTASCTEFNSAALATILASPEARAVIISAAWDGYATGDPLLSAGGDYPTVQVSAERFRSNIAETVANLNAHGLAVLLVGAFPKPEKDPAACMERSAIQNRNSTPCFVQAAAGTMKRDHVVSDAFANVVGNVELFRPVPYFCHQDKCVYVEGEQIMFMDATHLSAAGNAKFAGDFERSLRSLLQAP